jgi:6-pyruvoyltetrahydropterin/6-carboxytetrahydropterin synthase
MTVRLTRNYRFVASHRLHLDHLSPQENQNLFGKCNNPYGHGHNYVVSISVRGPIEERTGLAVSVPALDALVQREVIDRYDHRYLNFDVPEFATVPSTTENMAFAIRDHLQANWEAALGPNAPQLVDVKVQETKRNSVALTLIQ